MRLKTPSTVVPRSTPTVNIRIYKLLSKFPIFAVRNIKAPLLNLSANPIIPQTTAPDLAALPTYADICAIELFKVKENPIPKRIAEMGIRYLVV